MPSYFSCPLNKKKMLLSSYTLVQAKVLSSLSSGDDTSALHFTQDLHSIFVHLHRLILVWDKGSFPAPHTIMTTLSTTHAKEEPYDKLGPDHGNASQFSENY